MTNLYYRTLWYPPSEEKFNIPCKSLALNFVWIPHQSHSSSTVLWHCCIVCYCSVLLSWMSTIRWAFDFSRHETDSTISISVEYCVFTADFNQSQKTSLMLLPSVLLKLYTFSTCSTCRSIILWSMIFFFELHNIILESRTCNLLAAHQLIYRVSVPFRFSSPS